MSYYMLDTNIINKILDENIDLGKLKRPDLNLAVTHIQFDEIENTSNPERRTKLREIISKMPKGILPTQTAVFGISKFGEAKFSDGENYNNLKNSLDGLKNKKNNMHDSLIAEFAFDNNCIVVTEDQNLRNVLRENKLEAIGWPEFLGLINEK